MIGNGAKFSMLFGNQRPLIGMIHLPAMPGRSGHPGVAAVIKKALRDLHALEHAGFDAALVENDGDHPPRFIDPFQPTPRDRINGAMGAVMRALLCEASIPVGLEIIYDMVGTIEVAHDVGARFVRLDVFVDTVQSDEWGQVIPAAHAPVARRMRELGANDIVLLTDIHVKHATVCDGKTLQQSAQEAIARRSGALIVTGKLTGQPPAPDELRLVKRVAGPCPVLVGSGFDLDNASCLLAIADGAIVGTSIKGTSGKGRKRVDRVKAHRMVEAVRGLRA